MFYTRESVTDKFLFMPYPKVLLYGENYKGKMKSAERELYILLLERIKLSVKNNWFDAEDKAYCIYSNDVLCEVLGISEPTLIKFKKTLARLDLMEEKPVKDQPNRIYVKMLKVMESDIQYLMKMESDEVEPPTPANEPQSIENKGDLKNLSHVTKKTLVTQLKKFKPSNTEYYSNKEFNKSTTTTLPLAEAKAFAFDYLTEMIKHEKNFNKIFDRIDKFLREATKTEIENYVDRLIEEHDKAPRKQSNKRTGVRKTIRKEIVPDWLQEQKQETRQESKEIKMSKELQDMFAELDDSESTTSIDEERARLEKELEIFKNKKPKQYS